MRNGREQSGQARVKSFTGNRYKIPSDRCVYAWTLKTNNVLKMSQCVNSWVTLAYGSLLPFAKFWVVHQHRYGCATRFEVFFVGTGLPQRKFCEHHHSRSLQHCAALLSPIIAEVISNNQAPLPRNSVFGIREENSRYAYIPFLWTTYMTYGWVESSTVRPGGCYCPDPLSKD